MILRLYIVKWYIFFVEFVPATVGVQVTALFPLFTQPEPGGGLTNVKSSVFVRVTLSIPVLPTGTVNGIPVINIARQIIHEEVIAAANTENNR